LFDDRPSGTAGTGDLFRKPTCFLSLTDNGGSSQFAHTQTMEPMACAQSTVWALNGGPSTGLSDDQRTFTRPVGAATDIGAFECQTNECDETELGAPSGGNGVSPVLAAALPTTASQAQTTYEPSRSGASAPLQELLAREMEAFDSFMLPDFAITPKRLDDSHWSESDPSWPGLFDALFPRLV
jgi:hypothetical protein